MHKFSVAFIAGLLSLGLASCGIPGDTALSDLTQEDWQKVCASLNLPEEDVTADCGDGSSATVHATTVEECATNGFENMATCTATLDDYYVCQDAIEADPCDALGEACMDVFMTCTF